MTPEIAIVLVLLLVSFLLFAVEKLPVDAVAMLVLGVLLLSGIVTPEEGLSGFSHPATVTVAAMFVLSSAVSRTEAIEFLGLFLARLLRGSLRASMLIMMLGVGALSAFINNTATVALLIPVVMRVCRDTGHNPSKLLIPLSFASLLGGMCTLFGTSTNILVSTMARDAGLKPFGVFEFAPLGLALLGAGVAYLAVFGLGMLPDRPHADLATRFDVGGYITEVRLLPDSASVGREVSSAPLVGQHDLDILRVLRKGQVPPSPIVLQAGDVLRVRCGLKELAVLEGSRDLELLPRRQWTRADLSTEDTVLVEAIVAPNSEVVGRSLRETSFVEDYGAVVLALRHHGGLKHTRLTERRLIPGDALLIKLPARDLPRLKADPAFLVVSELDPPRPGRGNTLRAALIMLGVVASATTGAVPVVVAALVGCVLMVLAGCIPFRKVYHSIEWRVVFLLAGLLPLGVALEKTGAATLLANQMLALVGSWGPTAVLAALYLTTTVLTSVVSNNATAALLTPIALSTAGALGVDPRPFLVAITFGASTAFSTPMGYQTNLMIYSAGNYRFADFLRIGLPLSLLCLLLATGLIPRLWTF